MSLWIRFEPIIITTKMPKSAAAARPRSLNIIGDSPRAKGSRKIDIKISIILKTINNIRIFCLSPSLNVFSAIAQILCMIFLYLADKPILK